jgi:hypothetical protein
VPERLADVEKKGAEVLLTFPVTISAPDVEEETFKEKAARGRPGTEGFNGVT